MRIVVVRRVLGDDGGKSFEPVASALEHGVVLLPLGFVVALVHVHLDGPEKTDDFLLPTFAIRAKWLCGALFA